MAESDKIRIKQLDDKSDLTVWRVFVIGVISAKGIDNVIVPKRNGESFSLTETGTRCEATDEHWQQSSNIIVFAPSDYDLHVVRLVIGNPIRQ